MTDPRRTRENQERQDAEAIRLWEQKQAASVHVLGQCGGPLKRTMGETDAEFARRTQRLPSDG
jgi:hypothetical protein